MHIIPYHLPLLLPCLLDEWKRRVISLFNKGKSGQFTESFEIEKEKAGNSTTFFLLV